MDFYKKTEEWRVSDIINLAENNKLTLLTHQRPLKLKKYGEKTLIESIIKDEMLIPIYLSDLKSNYEYCKFINENVDSDYFFSLLNNGYKFSIEDGQHRIGHLQLINDSHFVSPKEKEKFLSSKIPIVILNNCTQNKLIKLFSQINSGRPINTDERIWGVNNDFNLFIKESFLSENKFIKLYKGNKIEYIERNFYKSIIKIIKVCSFHDKIYGNSSNTKEKYLFEFINSNLPPYKFVPFLSLKEKWYDLIKNLPTKDKFVTQSNLFFILHINKKLNLNLDDKTIIQIMKNLNDTRSSPEKRYVDIFNQII